MVFEKMHVWNWIIGNFFVILQSINLAYYAKNRLYNTDNPTGAANNGR